MLTINLSYHRKHLERFVPSAMITMLQPVDKWREVHIIFFVKLFIVKKSYIDSRIETFFSLWCVCE